MCGSEEVKVSGLKPCKSCQQQVSTDAASCPKCGDASPHGARTTKNVNIKNQGNGLILVGAIIVALAFVFWGIDKHS